MDGDRVSAESRHDRQERSPRPSSPEAAPGWRGVVVYLLLAFGLSWVTQVAVALTVRGSGDLPELAMGPGMLGIAVLLMWPPAVAAIVARQWVERSGFRDAGLRRGPWRYVVLAWLIPPLLVLLAMVVSLPIYPFDPTFSTLRDMLGPMGPPPVPLEVLVAAQIVQGLTLGTLINCLFTFGEEFGWRGYLLPRLMALLGPWAGLLAHGAIWGAWHAPIIGIMGYNYPRQPVLGILLFVVFCTLIGVIFGWLRLASNSVLPPTVAHASLNAVAGVPIILLADMDTAVAGALWSPVGWIALLLAIRVLHATGALRVVSASRGSPAVG